MDYWVMAFYILTPLEDPHAERDRMKDFFAHRDLMGRIYISHEGINAQVSASPEAGEELLHWLRNDARFRDVQCKIHTWPEHCFPRATIKVRPQLVAIGHTVPLSQGGIHLSPLEWKRRLEERDSDTIVIDTRNDYEWSVGYFEGALLPPLKQFREFPAYARRLRQQYDPETTQVMMYCTGGIRCEFYSALMKEEGFTNVYQLQGGVIQYGLDVGSDHWRGKLFVFDDRLAVSIAEPTEDVVGVCLHCKAPSDVYFNCANPDCNELFLSCGPCADRFQGCCSPMCRDHPRIRPYQSSVRPKPFRRLSTCSCTPTPH